MTAIPLLDVRDLTVEFATRRGIVSAVQHVDLSIAKGETVGIVGESGSGKSVTSYAVMRILDRAGRIAEGSVTFTNIDLRQASEDDMRELRGREMSMIFQNPRAALNPIRKVGRQIEDVLLEHVKAAPDDVTDKAIEMLEQVRIARPRERYHAYPFELSGGMCQRVVIALALACQPQLLIADEPTTGLDVTTQKTVMELIVELTRERGMSTILITHDLGLAATYCDQVVVMEKGHVVETATAREIFTAPSHRYTRKLMRATPRPGVSLRDLLARGRRAGCRWRHRHQAQRRRTARRCWWSTSWSRNIPRKGLDGLGARARQADAPRARAGAGRVPRGGRHQLHRQSRRKRRPRRRIRLRQVHHLDHGDAADRQDRRRRSCSTARTSATFRPRASPSCRCARRIQMVFQDPTDSLNPRFTAARAIADPILRLGDIRGRDAVRAAARSWRARSACRSICSTASRTSFPAARRRVSASRARSR